jgi:5-methylcytosine-specific restriction endonuclease McrA
MSLYKFTNAHARLDQLGFPKLENRAVSVVVERREFTRADVEQEMDWRDDGVYMLINGEYRRGYLYNKDYDVKQYKTMPSYHLTQCSVLRDRYIANGTLNRFYFWSNAEKVMVTQRRSGEKYPDQILKVCSRCVSELTEVNISNRSTTEDEFPKQEEVIEPTVTTDFYGRPMNWKAISKDYRKRQNYTCRFCGTGGPDIKKTNHRRFFDTDHIIAQELMNTSDANLQCLCKLCHAFKDDVHEAHLQRPHVLEKLKEFVTLYQDILTMKNPALLRKFKSKYLA